MYFFYYFPVGIDASRRRFPIMTAFFAAVCVVVFVLNKYFATRLGLDFYSFIYYAGFSGPVSLVSAAFLHFGYVHLVGNLLYLVLFGSYLEDRLGSILYTILFLGSAAVGNFAQAQYNVYLLDTNMGIIGASGAVSGILGAFLIRLFRARVRIAWWVFAPLLAYTRAGRQYVPVVVAMAIWAVLQSVRSLMQFEGASANVAHITHLAGFCFGVVLALLTGGLREGRLEGHKIKARRYLAKGEFYGAQDELESYVARQPDDGGAMADLARIMVQAGDIDGARSRYARACELLLRAGERGKAEDTYEEMLRAYPGTVLPPDAQLDMAFGLERNLKYDPALESYLGFSRHYSEHSEAPFALLRAANLLRNTFGRSEDAMASYQLLIDRYPMDAWSDFAREQVRLLV